MKEHFVHCFSFSPYVAFWCNLFFYIIIIYLITITFTVTLVVGCERSIAVGTDSSLLLCRGGELARLVACVLHLKLSGVAGEEDFGSWFSSWSLLCFILMCCLSPFSETLV